MVPNSCPATISKEGYAQHLLTFHDRLFSLMHRYTMYKSTPFATKCQLRCDFHDFGDSHRDEFTFFPDPFRKYTTSVADVTSLPQVLGMPFDRELLKGSIALA